MCANEDLMNFIYSATVIVIIMTEVRKYAGLLPWALKLTPTPHIVLLLGREANVLGWSEAKKWSDFGGSPESKDVSIVDSIIREAYQETMGILGCPINLKEQIESKSSLIIDLPELRATICVLQIPYSEELPVHFNRMYQYITKCTEDHPKWTGFRHIPSCPEGFVEKIEMKWLPLDDFKRDLESGQTTEYRNSFVKSMRLLLLNSEVDWTNNMKK